jgi:DNA-binding NtrC family response regulator
MLLTKAAEQQRSPRFSSRSPAHGSRSHRPVPVPPWGDCVQTILVLEDDTSIMALIRLVVGQNGYNILEATTARQAFERFEENDAQVDLLIADVTLPAGSGIHVALELQSLLPYLKIIIMSGYPSVMWEHQDSAELEELPSDSVITLQKPFLPATLLDSVHRFLGLPISVAPALQMKAAS